MPIYRGGPKYAVIVVNLGISSSNQNPCWESFLKDKAHLLSPEISSYHFFFARKFPIYSSSNMVVQRIPEIIEIITRSVDYLATTTNTEASPPNLMRGPVYGPCAGSSSWRMAHTVFKVLLNIPLCWCKFGDKCVMEWPSSLSYD